MNVEEPRICECGHHEDDHEAGKCQSPGCECEEYQEAEA